MGQDLIEKGYIPFDKSWIIRMGVLDLLKGHEDTIKFLEQHYGGLGDDLKALHRASIQWNSGEPINVGESGTLYRFLTFASWKLGLPKEFVTEGTLTERIEKGEICNNPDMVNWPLERLLTLSIAVLSSVNVDCWETECSIDNKIVVNTNSIIMDTKPPIIFSILILGFLQ